MFVFVIRFSETIFEESEDHTYEMEYDEPKNDGDHMKVKSNCISWEAIGFSLFDQFQLSIKGSFGSKGRFCRIILLWWKVSLSHPSPSFHPSTYPISRGCLG